MILRVLTSVLSFAIALAASADPPRMIAESLELEKPALFPDGTLAAFSLQTLGGVQTMVVRFSCDDGQRWTPVEPAFTLPREAGTFGYWVVVVDRAGEAHFFFLNDPSTGSSGSETGVARPGKKESLNIWHASWRRGQGAGQAPRQIWEGRGGDLQSAIQLRSGRLLLPISYRVRRSWRERDEGFAAYIYPGQFNATALYSDDSGKTWHQSPSVLKVPAPDLTTILGAVEPVVLQLKDGRVWMLIRTQNGRFYESYSKDDGKTWSLPKPTSLISSDSPAGLVRLPDGRIMLLVNRCLRYAYAYGGRHVLHAAVSSDEGKTWTGFREVVRDPLRSQIPPTGGDFGVSYPFTSLDSKGRVVFGLGVRTGTRSQHPERQPGDDAATPRWMVVVDPAWLYETRQRTDFSKGLDDWSIFGVRGVSLTSHPSKPDLKVLGLKKPEPEWPSGAVWNFPMGTRGRLVLKLMVKRGFSGALLGLTDHFSPPFDAEDEFFNMFNLVLGPEGTVLGEDRLKSDVWHTLALNWDVEKQRSEVILDGRSLTSLRLLREGPGVCYLRIRSTAYDTDQGGLLIESVEVEVDR
ncbi:MAG TPA: sialidase family protein [Acidobacteriota bacterium]|nr:sialidase family protein [Acidobacteriota bacterium]